MNLRIIATLSCAVAAMFVSSCSTNGAVTGMGKSSSDALVLARVGETAQGFVQPLAPSRSAAPSSKLPKLGRDKHKMPFYHPAQRTRVVRTTAYTHSERDHLAYGPRNAVGTALKYTSSVRSAAADWSVYPLGTTFRIKGQPYLYVVDDYGSALVGTGTIDIYQPNKKLMKEWGRRYVELTIVRWGDPANSLEVLGSRRGYRHCRAMYAALQHRGSKGGYATADWPMVSMPAAPEWMASTLPMCRGPTPIGITPTMREMMTSRRFLQYSSFVPAACNKRFAS